MTNFIRIQDVMKKTGIARSTIWLWVKENRFPKPVKLSPRITVWEEDKIQEWQKARVLEIPCQSDKIISRIEHGREI
jgi:prophage regulatory protein